MPATRSARGLSLATPHEDSHTGHAAGLVRVASAAISEVVGRSQMDFVLYEGRGEIAKKTETLMQEMLDRYGTGIQIQSVSLQDSQPPEQARPAFDDAV